MCPEAARKLSDLLLHPEAPGELRAEKAVSSRGWVAELSTYLRLADPELYQHSIRVGRWARRTALHLGFDRERLRVLNVAARFHDVGKVPFLHLVNKPGPLSLEERRSLDSHPALGARMLIELGPPLDGAAPWVAAHHERYDLDGKPSLLGARIIAVADAYDAITSARPYHRPSHPTEALKDILRQSGRQFDPVVVAAFLDLPPFAAMVDAFTLGTLRATAERIVAKDRRHVDLGSGWVRRTFSDATGALWEAIEGEGAGVGVAPGFRRIVLRKLEDPEQPPVPGPITLAPLEILPSEWLRGFVRLVEERAEETPCVRKNGNGARHAYEASPEPAAESAPVASEAEAFARAESEGAVFEDAASEGAVSGAEAAVLAEALSEELEEEEDAVPESSSQTTDDEPVVAVDCAEATGEVELVPESATRRHLLRGIETERLVPHRFRARVRIAVGEQEHEGEATGADVPGARAEVAARAALAALEKGQAGKFELALQGAKVVRAFDRKLVIVGVYALRARDVTSLVGASLVRDSVEQAGVLAALQATNRWVTWAASQPSPA